MDVFGEWDSLSSFYLLSDNWTSQIKILRKGSPFEINWILSFCYFHRNPICFNGFLFFNYLRCKRSRRSRRKETLFQLWTGNTSIDKHVIFKKKHSHLSLPYSVTLAINLINKSVMHNNGRFVMSHRAIGIYPMSRCFAWSYHFPSLRLQN